MYGADDHGLHHLSLKNAEHMEENLLPWNAASPVASPVGPKDEVIYGKNYRILRTDQLPEKSHEVDASGTMWEGAPFRTATKEDGLTIAAVFSQWVRVRLRTLRQALAWATIMFFLPAEESAETHSEGRAMRESSKSSPV